MTVRALVPATDELAVIADNLEKERRGYGRRFLRAYREVLDNLVRFPQIYSPVEDGVADLEIRNAILERFDYRIVYLARADEVVILAIAHTSRRPEHWHRRLRDDSLS
jgi:plasmid stabilization system protein ParE